MEEVEEVEEVLRRELPIDDIEDVEAEGITRTPKLVSYCQSNNIIDMNPLRQNNVEYEMNSPEIESEVVRQTELLLPFSTNSI